MHERIEINPEIMGGKPVIRGTRVPVEIVLRKLGAGVTAEAIVGDHPRLTLEDIRAAQAFAAETGSQAQSEPCREILIERHSGDNAVRDWSRGRSARPGGLPA